MTNETQTKLDEIIKRLDIIERKINSKLTVSEFMEGELETFDEWRTFFDKPINKGIAEDKIRNSGGL